MRGSLCPYDKPAGWRQYSRCFALVLGSMLLAAGLQAQNPGAVSGTLLDQSTRQPVPFATVVLVGAQDSSLVAGTQSAESGAFSLEKVALGTYVLRVSALGYTAARQRLTLTAGAPVLRLGAVPVAPLAVQLRSVVVQGEKDALVNDLDKKIINVSKDLNSTGGTAADVLQKVPSVAVDQNGQASLRGAGVTLYVDGQPAPNSLRLDQLPASRLETIEVITNPSARYSAQGGGGIINLVLKKETQAGWNGQATATLGTRDKYTGSLSLNRKVGKLNIFGNYDGRSNRFYGSSALYQVVEADGRTTGTDQSGTTFRSDAHHSFRLGADYSPGDDQTLTVNAEVNPTKSHDLEELTTVLTRDGSSPVSLRNQNPVVADLYNGRSAASYRRTWPAQKGRELTARALYIWDGGTVLVGQRVLDGPADYPRQERRQDLNVDIQMPSAQVDYVQPLGDKRRLEVGLKTEVMLTPGQADYLVQSPGTSDFIWQNGLSYTYHYRQYIPAGYVNYQQSFAKWSYQAGLRAEYTRLRGDVVPTGSLNQQYLNLFPSATLGRTLPGDQRLQLSYSRRLNRPNFLQIVALPIYADARNYQVGNPELRPEYLHVGELNHQIAWGQTTISTTLFGRQTNQAIQAIRQVDTMATRLSGQPDFVTRTSYRNFGHTTSYGVEASVNQSVLKWWKVLVNGSFYRRQVTSYAGDGTRRNFTGTAYLLNTFTPTKGLDVQLSGSYQAPLLIPQGRVAALYGVDVALRQRLLHERAALTLRLSDIFNTRRNYTQYYADGLSADVRTKYETRIGYLGLTWFLGANKPPQKIDQLQGDTGGFGH